MSASCELEALPVLLPNIRTVFADSMSSESLSDRECISSSLAAGSAKDGPSLSGPLSMLSSLHQ